MKYIILSLLILFLEISCNFATNQSNESCEIYYFSSIRYQEIQKLIDMNYTSSTGLYKHEKINGKDYTLKLINSSDDSSYLKDYIIRYPDTKLIFMTCK